MAIGEILTLVKGQRLQQLEPALSIDTGSEITFGPEIESQ